MESTWLVDPPAMLLVAFPPCSQHVHCTPEPQCAVLLMGDVAMGSHLHCLLAYRCFRSPAGSRWLCTLQGPSACCSSSFCCSGGANKSLEHILWRGYTRSASILMQGSTGMLKFTKTAEVTEQSVFCLRPDSSPYVYELVQLYSAASSDVRDGMHSSGQPKCCARSESAANPSAMHKEVAEH